MKKIFVVFFILIYSSLSFSQDKSCLKETLLLLFSKKGEARELFDFYSKPYLENLDIKKLKPILKKIKNEELLTSEELALYCEKLTPVVKKLRNAFLVSSSSHEIPKDIDEFATLLGHVKDGLELEKGKFASKKAKEALEFIKEDRPEKILKSIKNFKPAEEKSLRKWVLSQRNYIENDLGKSQITAREFHELRKRISRLFVFYNAKAELSLNTKILKDFSTELAALNEKMGLYHDKLMSARISKSLDYERDLVEFPLEIQTDVKKIVGKLTKAD